MVAPRRDPLAHDGTTPKPTDTSAKQLDSTTLAWSLYPHSPMKSEGSCQTPGQPGLRTTARTAPQAATAAHLRTLDAVLAHSEFRRLSAFGYGRFQCGRVHQLGQHHRGTQRHADFRKRADHRVLLVPGCPFPANLLSENMTILWIATTAASQASFPHTTSGSEWLQRHCELVVRGDRGAVTNTLITRPYLDRWYHVAVVRSEGTIATYVDGRFVPAQGRCSATRPAAGWLYPWSRGQFQAVPWRHRRGGHSSSKADFERHP